MMLFIRIAAFLANLLALQTINQIEGAILQGTFVEGIKEEVVLSPAHALSLIAAGEGI